MLQGSLQRHIRREIRWWQYCLPQGDTTDDLIQKAEEINPKASAREMDMLLSTGEQISVSLCAMAIEALGYPVISLTGWQSGISTNTVSGDARIRKVDTERIEAELNQKKIVIVTGFQGIDRNKNITTLGRGGSDTSAVALAVGCWGPTCARFIRMWTVFTRQIPERLQEPESWMR